MRTAVRDRAARAASMPPYGLESVAASAAPTGRAMASDADILVPQLRLVAHEVMHERDASGVVDDLDRDTAALQPRFLAHERTVLADHHARDAVQRDRAAAHRARRQGRVDHALAIHLRRVAPRVLERVHLAVQDRAALLHAAV